MRGRACRWAVVLVVTALLAGCAQHARHAHDKEHDATLSGAQCVPANTSMASGSSTLRVLPDGRVTGGVRHTGMAATAAHLHMAPTGANGPAILALHKAGDALFAAPPHAQLTAAQQARYLAGEVYVSVQSTAYPAGEIRAQLRP